MLDALVLLKGYAFYKCRKDMHFMHLEKNMHQKHLKMYTLYTFVKGLCILKFENDMYFIHLPFIHLERIPVGIRYILKMNQV